MSTNRLTDSIDNTLEMLKEILRAAPPDARRQSQAAACHIENAFMQLRRDFPNNPNIALGCAFAVFTIANMLVESQDDKKEGGLVQLLN